jgi:hypothetical protein
MVNISQPYRPPRPVTGIALLLSLLLLLVVVVVYSIANGILPGGSGTTIRHNTKIHTALKEFLLKKNKNSLESIFYRQDKT